MMTGVLLCPKLEAMLAAQKGSNMRKIPLIMASHPRTVTTTRQPPLQTLCTRTIAKPATRSRMPETKISPGSLPICLAISGK